MIVDDYSKNKRVLISTRGFKIKPLKFTIDTSKGLGGTDFFINLSTNSDAGQIKWGDNSSTTTIPQTESKYSHTYNSSGIYTIELSGGINGIIFNTIDNGLNNNNLKVISIEQWGQYQYNQLSFQGCANMISNYTDFPSISTNANLENIFNGCSVFNGDISGISGKIGNIISSFTNAISYNSDLSTLDVSLCTDFNNIFNNATVFNKPLNNWNTANVTMMNNMFRNAINFNQNLDNWNTSKVTNMSFMFSGAINFDGDVTTWDTSKVTNMSNMFINSSFNRDIGGWTVSSVTNMAQMFSNTQFNQDIGDWDVSKVNNMHNMFSNTPFDQDIGAWDVSKVNNMENMFANSPFNRDIGGWTVSSVTNMVRMFRNTPFDQDIGAWDVSSVTNMAQMFNNTPFDQDIGAWDVSSVTNMGQMFRDTPFDQDIGAWDVSKVTDMNNMFFGSQLSTANYDALLTGWTGWTAGNATRILKTGINFHGGNSTFTLGSDAEDARAYLINNRGWTINDGGGV